MIAGILGISGCTDDNNGTGSTTGNGRLVLLMHDAPADNFSEIWLTVESVRLIGAGSDDDSGSTGPVILDNPVRMDFLALESVSLILASAEVGAGEYSKIRLQVSDPEFVRDDDSVFTGDDIQLVANGHVDLNAQGTGIHIEEGSFTIVSLDLDARNSIQVTETGNGRYILRPQILIDADLEPTQAVLIEGARVVSINTEDDVVHVALSESGHVLPVTFTSQTQIQTLGGLPVAIGAVNTGATVDIIGTMDAGTGTITASQILIVN